MPFYEKDKVRIRYEEAGTGFPLFIIHGGGLDSAVTFPDGPFDAVAEFRDEYRCITMDLRNSNLGQSSGPLEVDRPWDSHTDDHLGLLDHLGVDKFLIMGFCIGNPMIWNILKRAPERVVAVVSVQPSGVDPNNPDYFYDRNLRLWAPPLLARHPEWHMDTVEQFLRKMYKDVEFVITVSREFVENSSTPLLVLPDDVEPHPLVTSMDMVRLAPRAQVSLYPWADTKKNTTLALRHVRTFLKANRPDA
jgi:pimeloyl-ACP methyl ester carboxylesterase